MKLAIMQPYFFPYLGYWQLLNLVDVFIVYDNIEYTKKGWINRNRFLQKGKDATFTIPIKKDSDFLTIYHRYISQEFKKDKLLAQFKNAYCKAPYYKQILPLIEKIIYHEELNLFKFIFHSIKETCSFLDIETKIIISSAININHNLKSQDKVISFCEALNADDYINPIGGISLYEKDRFIERGINLKFIKTKEIIYHQFEDEFVPNLSIIDVMMFNGKDETKKLLNEYELV